MAKYAARAVLLIAACAIAGVSTGVLKNETSSTVAMIQLVLVGIGVGMAAVVGFIIYRAVAVRPLQKSIRRKLAAEWAALDPNDPEYSEKKFQLSKGSTMSDRAAAEGRRELIIAYSDWVLKYPAGVVDAAMCTLRYMGVKNPAKRLTAEHLDAVLRFSPYWTDDASGDEWLAINRYAFENPGDAHDMEFVISRGITDLREIVEMIDELRTFPSTALVEGAL
jgi:hypothetical protein